MTLIETQIRLIVAWARSETQARVKALDEEDPERGDGILIWVIMTAILAAAAIAIVTIIVVKATDKANDTKTQ